ncbi:MAG: DUF2520 domain-containing protein [Bdellovibrionaceae bacterium]|nr:DUF2520 domain-containing protein [Pseudobdellovibrionaceae bacterium]
MKTISSKIHVCLVGNGRLALQLKYFLDQNLYSFSHVYRSLHSPTEIADAITHATHVWLAIHDQAIEEFYAQYVDKNDSQKIWVHFSGAHHSQNIHSAHPLMTFSKIPMSLSDLARVHFVVTPPTKQSTHAIILTDLLPHFANPWSLLPDDKKALYHALCVVAGNFPMILWSEVHQQFQALAIPPEALSTYIDRVVTNFKNEGPSALTGPIVRNDIKTIKDNLVALDGHRLKPVYESFLKAKGISL